MLLLKRKLKFICTTDKYKRRALIELLSGAINLTLVIFLTYIFAIIKSCLVFNLINKNLPIQLVRTIVNFVKKKAKHDVHHSEWVTQIYDTELLQL